MISKILFSKISNNKPIIFLDRDGIINIKPKEHDYVKSWSEFIFTSDIINLLKSFRDRYQFIIISNQQGIAKRLMTIADFENISKKMVDELRKHNVDISGIYYCPHLTNENCICRKPKPGLILEALSDFSINPSMCALIGDSDQDMKAGKAAGIEKTFLLDSNVIKKENTDKIVNALK